MTTLHRNEQPTVSNKRNFREKRTIIGWSISGLSSRPGGIASSLYLNLGNISQYGIFIDGGYQFNNYSNTYIDGIVNFPRYSFGLSYNLWLADFSVIEAYASYGKEYASGLNWKDFNIWDYAPENVHTNFIRMGLRVGVRLSPHAELFGAYNFNFTDGPAIDMYGNQVEINGTKYEYQTIFPDRNTENWEVGLRFVIY